MSVPYALRDALGGEWSVLSGGLSHHVWRVAIQDQPDLTVRIADDTVAPQLFARDPNAEWSALSALAQTGLAPRPVRRFPNALVTEYISGHPWRGEFEAAGTTLRALHDCAVPDSLPTAPRCALQDGRNILELCHDRSLSALMPHAALLSGPDVFLHGDAVPGNIVMQNGQARLIDWQCPKRGPALHDVAMFLSPAMQLLGRGRVASISDKQAFVRGYGALADTALAPLHWRMACHCQWRIEQGHNAYRAALQAELTALALATRPQ